MPGMVSVNSHLEIEVPNMLLKNETGFNERSELFNLQLPQELIF